jgi:hypothetical protein
VTPAGKAVARAGSGGEGDLGARGPAVRAVAAAVDGTAGGGAGAGLGDGTWKKMLAAFLAPGPGGKVPGLSVRPRRLNVSAWPARPATASGSRCRTPFLDSDTVSGEPRLASLRPPVGRAWVPRLALSRAAAAQGAGGSASAHYVIAVRRLAHDLPRAIEHQRSGPVSIPGRSVVQVPGLTPLPSDGVRRYRRGRGLRIRRSQVRILLGAAGGAWFHGGSNSPAGTGRYKWVGSRCFADLTVGQLLIGCGGWRVARTLNQ